MRASRAVDLVALVSLAGVIGCRSANDSSGITAIEKPVLLRYSPKLGEKYAYHVESTIDVGEERMLDLAMTMSFACKSVSKHKATYVVRMNDVKVGGTAANAGPGEMYKNMAGTPMEITYDNRGQELSVRIDGMDMGADSAGDTEGLVFAQRAVKSGDTWENKVSSGGIQGTMVYKLEGMQSVGGKDAYRITGRLKPGGKMQSDPESVFLIEAKTLHIIKMSGGGTMEHPRGLFRVKFSGKAV